ncbi:Glucan endo-1,3-beta-glucosidase, basic isoform precursor [Dorcoceras hygrometricum]|uniref:Glucan endo-1,3-beta-glucosidase, basic isoform n=1 Tax=Dorcoceras hygrometricum TaxID=472368 RepID=A0A2Z7AU77_9LAMI|nr:Glucan endo-1,3-beta-glucosidase, basic isoform precursor [Dorcoceras hygrometricum]
MQAEAADPDTTFLTVDWAVKMRIRPPEIDTSICDAKYRVSLAAGLGEIPMHVGVDASLSRIHLSLSCVDILCYLRG